MRSLRLKNFRGFEDTGRVPIRRITVLVGANSTGKSSFLRVFPLLRQSIQTRTSGPILWYDERLVDYGSFAEARRKGSEDESICFEFGMVLEPLLSMGLGYPDEFEVNLLVRFKEQKQRTYASDVNILLMNDHSKIQFDESGKIVGFHSNGMDYYTSDRWIRHYSGPVPHIEVEDDPLGEFYLSEGDKMPDDIIAILKQIGHGRMQDNTYEEIASQLSYGTNEKILESVRHSFDSPYWQEQLSEMTASSDWVSDLRKQIFLRSLPPLLETMTNVLHDEIGHIAYLKPFRVEPQRYYRIKELAVDELDPVGTNLPMFLHSLSGEERASFESWLSEHLRIEVKVELSGGHVALTLGTPGQERFNLVDMGFGFSQVLPVLAQLWLSQQEFRGNRERREVRILAIEQPELHLHPLFQAKLADLFVGAIRASERLQVVVETHSMALVERLGEMIEEGSVARDDVSIVLFEKSNGLCTVRLAEFDDEGVLENWPPGFLSW